MIKVLHVTFDMSIGGAQQVIRQLVENFDKEAVHSELVCIDNLKGELGELLEQKNINVHLLNRRPGLDFKLIHSLNRLIKDNQFDVVHCHQYTPYFYGVIAAMMTKSKVIFTEHGRFYPDYGTIKRKVLNPLLALFTFKITAISEATKEALIKFENFKSRDIEVIYNGIPDLSAMSVNQEEIKNEFNIPKDKFVLGTISRLQPIKNQKLIINAFDQLTKKHNNLHLIIVGDGESYSQLNQLCHLLKLEHKVTFTGFQNDPYRFHKIIDIFLLTSFSEGTSMTLLEAMSFTKPCVVTNVGGNPELIENGYNGLVCESDDLSCVVAKCDTLIHDKVIYEKLGRNARTVFLDMFRVDKMILNFINLYQSTR